MTTREVRVNARRIGDTTDVLGESCVWSEREQALYWIDVRGRMLRRFDHRSGAVESHALPELVGSIGLLEDGGILVAMQTMVARFDRATARLARIAAPEPTIPNQRFNDGRCDRQGRFWVGTMDDVGRGPIATLYRLDPDGLTPMIAPITIPNSLSWSPDGTTMYLAGVEDGVITAYDFDPVAGVPSRPRRFARVAPPPGPDGSTVDAEGFLWNAEYDGWRLTRYAPDGSVDRVVDVPVQRPTCCTFGGPDLATLYVTTASQRLTAAELAEQPLAGGLLALDVGVCGLPESYCRWPR
jgi:sugar lactone lactonase YvrE